MLYKELKMSHAPQSSEESTDSEDGTFSTVNYNEGLAPYRFEPERNSSTSGSSSDSDSNNGHGSEAPARVGNKNLWIVRVAVVKIERLMHYAVES